MIAVAVTKTEADAGRPTYQALIVPPPRSDPQATCTIQYEDCVTVLVAHAAVDIPTHDAIRPPGLRGAGLY